MPEPLDGRGGTQGKVSIRESELSGNVSISEMLLRGSIKKQTRELKELHEKARETDKLRRALNSLRRKNRKLEREINQCRHVGAQMSNLCFNWSQRVGVPLSERNAEVMTELYIKWDAIVRASKGDMAIKKHRRNVEARGREYPIGHELRTGTLL